MIIGNRTTFALDIEPVVPSWERRYEPEARGWGGLAIWLRDENICRHLEPGTDRAVERLYLPLGPLANWLVVNWAAIAFEERPAHFPAGMNPRRALRRWSTRTTPGQIDEEQWYEARRLWWSRHWWEAGGEGAVFPEVAFVRSGDELVVGWAEVCPRGQRHRREGMAALPWQLGRDVLQEFVTAVAEGFREGHKDTYAWVRDPAPLATAESASVERALAFFAGRELQELCELAGVRDFESLRQLLRLEASDPSHSPVVQVLRDLPPAAGRGLVARSLQLDAAALQRPEATTVSELRAIGREARRDVEGAEEQGHEAAKVVRQRLGLNGQAVSTDALVDLTAGCGIDVDPMPVAGDGESTRPDPVHSLLAVYEGRGGVATLLPTRRLRAPWARRFEIARILGLAVLGAYRGGALGSASSRWASARERRRSGAFAAELLLPEEGLRADGYGALDAAAEPDAFSEIMDKYGAGATATAHQLWNLGMLSSPELRDELIEELAVAEGDE